MTTTQLGRRDRKKLATREALRSAALRLVAERGFDRVTVEEIAEAADVSVRTLFNHFPSKEDVVAGTDPDRIEELRAALASRPSGEAPLHTLRAVLGEMTETIAARREEILLAMQVLDQTPALRARQLASFAVFERMLTESVAARSGLDSDRDVYPALTAAASVAALRTAVNLWRASDGARSLLALFDAAFDQLSVGLAQPLPLPKDLPSKRP